MAAPVVLVDAYPRRMADGAIVPVRLAGAGGVHPYYYGGQHYRAGLVGLPRTSASLDFDGKKLGGGGSAASVELRWGAATKEALAELAGLFWEDAAITVRIGAENAAGVLPPIAHKGTVLAAPADAGVLVIGLAEQAPDLKTPLLVDRFAGTGGLEGPVEFENQIKPRAWGRCFNVPGRLLDKAKNVWVFGDPRRGWQSFDAIRDRGVSPAAAAVTILDWQGSPEATFAALQVATAVEGGGVVCPSIACVKWWTTPAGDLHADVRGETGGGYAESAPGIVARIVAARSTLTFADGVLAAAQAARPAPCGYFVNADTTTSAEAISDILAGLSLSWLLVDGQIVFRPWTWTAPTRVARSEGVQRRSTVKPVASRKLAYRRNWAPMARGDLAAFVFVNDVIYDDGLPLQEAIVEAGKTAEWDKVADPTGTRPADNATNSRDPASPFGTSGTVADALATIRQVDADTAELKEARIALDKAIADLENRGDIAGRALDALRDTVIDESASRRQMEQAAGRISEAALQLLLANDRTETLVRDAGFYVDPADSTVKLWAVEQTRQRQNRVELTLDAQRALISTKASSNEVDEKILAAVLSPEQVAQLEPLIARIAAVEIVQDGLRAEINAKAELIELTKALARLTTAEQNISAAEGAITSKVEQTTFDELYTAVGAIQQTIESYGDVSRYELDLRQARADSATGSEGLVASIVGAHEDRERQFTQQALLRQEMTTEIDRKSGAVESRLSVKLEVTAAELDAANVEERRARIADGTALAEDIRGLRASSATQEGVIAELRNVTQEQAGGIASVDLVIRQQGRTGDQSGENALAAVVGADEARTRGNDELAEIQRQMTTTFTAGQAATALVVQTLRARIDAADSRFAEQVRTTADRFSAVTELVRVLSARYDDPTNGVAAAHAEIAALQQTTAGLEQSIATSIERVRAEFGKSVGDVGARVTAEVERLDNAVADANRASAQATSGVRAELLGEIDATQQAIETDVDAQVASARKDLTGEVERVDGLISSVGQRVDGVDGRVTSVGQEVERVDGRVTGVGQEVDRVDGRVDNVSDEVERVDGRVTGVGDDLAAAKNDIDGQIGGLSNRVTGEVQRLDQAVAEEGRVRASALEVVNATAAGQSGRIDSLRDVLIGPNGTVARAIQLLDVNGRITGQVSTNDGKVGKIDFLADVFVVTDPDTGKPLFYLDENGAVAANFRRSSIGYDNLAMGAAQKVAFFALPQDAVIPRGQTVQVVSITFTKEDADSLLKVMFNGDFYSPDDLQFTGSFTLDGSVIKSTRTNIILVDANAQMPITPFVYRAGVAAGEHTITFTVTNEERDNANLTIAAGSVIEVSELRKGSIGSVTGSGAAVVPPSDGGGSGGGGSGGGGYHGGGTPNTQIP